MQDKYFSFSDLARCERSGRDYRITQLRRAGAALLIVAPHGGRIEAGTSELAALIAGTEHSLFSFEGLKAGWRSRDLHITSHRFDQPDCLALLAGSAIACGIHGCRGESRVYLGGLDTDLSGLLARRLRAAGLRASADGHPYPGQEPLNVCNRGTSGRGVQLELTSDLRQPVARRRLAPILRRALAEYVSRLGARCAS